MMRQLGIFVLCVGLGYGCASYHFGKGGRVLPGGYDRVAVPMFVNKTSEVGIETFFTEELRTQFERSRLAKVTSEADAQLILRGTIRSLVFTGGNLITSTSNVLAAPQVTLAPTPTPVPTATPSTLIPNPLPNNAVLAAQYTVALVVHIEAHRASDDGIIWQSDFNSTGLYQAPLLGTPSWYGSPQCPSTGCPSKQSSDPIYNQNSRQMSVQDIAKNMMSEAHDRLTENF